MLNFRFHWYLTRHVTFYHIGERPLDGYTLQRMKGIFIESVPKKENPILF